MRNMRYSEVKSIINVILILSVTLMSGCGSDNDNPGEPSSPAVKGVLKVCRDWGASVSEVEGQSKDMVRKASSENTLFFESSDGKYTISYDFMDGKLRGSLLSVLSSDNSIMEDLDILRNYQYVGETDGASVYISTPDNTMAMTMMRSVGSTDYDVIGFVPIKSDLYDSCDPIVVTTEEPQNVTTTQLELRGSISGSETAEKAYMEYAYEADYSGSKRVSCSIKANEFSYVLKPGTPNVTVYYRAIVIIDDIQYEGEWLTAQTVTTPVYKIGDVYPSTGTPIGVVCEVTNGGMNGTILSLEQEYLKWDNESLFCYDYRAYNSSDGSKNDIGTTQPFGKWVASLGSGWFGPAKNQLLISKSDLSLINTTLRSLGKTEMDGSYWSSTQWSNNHAYVVTVTEKGYMGYENMYTFYNSKNQNRQARAMRYF